MTQDGEALGNHMRIAVGVVTHPSSKYRDTRSFRALLDALEESSGVNELHIEDLNRFSSNDVPVLARFLRPVIHAWVVRRVARFRGLGIQESLFRAYEILKLHVGHGFGARAVGEIIRNLNITAAHQAVWEWGLGAGAEWVGVFEDDLAVSEGFSANYLQETVASVRGLSPGLTRFVVFLSRSFSVSEHGAQAIVDSRDVTELGVSITLSRQGFSDTAAATLYERVALQEISAVIASFSPLLRATVPIDWLLDLVFIRIATCGERDQAPLMTAHLDPGPFEQQSLQQEA